MRDWIPLTQKRVKEICLDTEQDNPPCNWCPADVYCLAQEVLHLRALARSAARRIAALEKRLHATQAEGTQTQDAAQEGE